MPFAPYHYQDVRGENPILGLYMSFQPLVHHPDVLHNNSRRTPEGAPLTFPASRPASPVSEWGIQEFAVAVQGVTSALAAFPVEVQHSSPLAVGSAAGDILAGGIPVEDIVVGSLPVVVGDTEMGSLVEG